MPSMMEARVCECLTVPYEDGMSEKAVIGCSMSLDIGLVRLYSISFDRDALSIGKPVNVKKRLTAWMDFSSVECGKLPLFPLVVLMWSKYVCKAGSWWSS